MGAPCQSHSTGSASNHGEMAKRYFNIENELTFYGSYHHTLGNRLIHFICIPLISWSSLILLSAIHPSNAKPVQLGHGFAYQPSLAMLIVTGYQVYYMLLEPVAGLTFLPWSLLMYLNATYLYLSSPTGMTIGWTVCAASWIFQFVGHGVFEGKAPALKDNLVQALVTAPFFVHLELLFGIFGYRPELKKRVDGEVEGRLTDRQRGKRQ